MIAAKPGKFRRAALPVAAVSLLALSLADPAVARRAQPDPEEKQASEPARPTSAPVLALVSLKDQRVTIYDKDGAILHAPVSSGQTGYETPVGIYSVLQKEAEHYSNRYDDASMPFMQRITWTGVALHAGALPGYPASHGCVRLPYQFAERLFPLTKIGLRVVISRYDVAPSAISHPALFKPTPLRDAPAVLTKTSQEVATNATDDRMKLGAPPTSVEVTPELATRAAALQAIVQQKTAEAEEAGKKADAARLNAKQKSAERARAVKALRVAETAKKRADEDTADADRNLAKATADPKATDETKQKLQAEKDKAAAKLADATAKFETAKTEFQPKIDDYDKAVADAKAAEAVKQGLIAEARDAQRKMSPVSVFISRATQKIYIRQAFEPIYEGPVTIRDPDKPIGTHIYTAVDYAAGNSEMRWNVVSIGGRRAGDGGDEARDNRDDDDYYDDGWRRPRRQSSKNDAGRSAEAIPTDVGPASAALDRITIPQDVVDKISELVLPGSSLIISDEPAHKETGKATDFVVLISGEPQGGIKLRPKPRPDYYDDYWGGGGWGDNYGRRGRGGGYRGPVFQFW